MSIEINENVLKKEINQGIVPLGVPAAYKYDAALVENAKALVNASLNQIKNGYGYPFTAATAVAMADTTKIYVYTGSETGYTNGNWYYYNGTAWVSGGVYNSTALETDKTLTVSGAAADAAITGESFKRSFAGLSNITDKVAIKPDTYNVGFIAVNGTLNRTNTNYYFLEFTIPDNAYGIKWSAAVAGIASNYAVIAYYDENGDFISCKPNINTSSSNAMVEVNELIPVEAKFVKCTAANSESIRAKRPTFFTKYGSDYADVAPIVAHERGTAFSRVVEPVRDVENNIYGYCAVVTRQFTPQNNQIYFDGYIRTSEPATNGMEIYVVGYNNNFTNRSIVDDFSYQPENTTSCVYHISSNQYAQIDTSSYTHFGIILRVQTATYEKDASGRGKSKFIDIFDDFTINGQNGCLVKTYNEILNITQKNYSYVMHCTPDNVTIDNPLESKSLTFMGDSLTAVYYKTEEESWPYLIAKRNRSKYTNLGISGNPLAEISSYTENSPMCDRVNTIPAESNYIMVMGGANDYNYSIPIGNNTDTEKTTFKGAINYMIDYIITNYPRAKLVFATTYQRTSNKADEAYANAMLEVCRLKGVPCIDNYHESGVHFFNEAWITVYGANNALGNNHLNALGDEYVSWIFENKLKSI
ncbi:SGNH/GDSL hydrolase family protein [Selenomonas ruminantium]|uniref:SGNH/GDSL hydrolase family protein n=1 Tax=Selenomonas ruminantium TaxID=971 RepID=UPI00041324BB|nr:SGNH/GDSL hydrolase family protein [Selenomonas ruminantium]